MKKEKRGQGMKWVMAAPISLWMIVFVAIPFIYIVAMSFMKKGAYGGVEVGFTLDNYKQAFQPLYMKVFGESMIIALIVTLICILIAYPFTYYIAQKSEVQRTILMAMVTLPFLVTSLIRLFSWTNILRKNGMINTLLIKWGWINEPLQMIYNKQGAILGLVYILLPFMILPLYSSIEKLDTVYLEASSDLGANGLRTFMYITLPLTMPGIFAGSLLVFIPALGLYYVTDLLGGNKLQLIGNIIKNEFITARNWPVGAGLSVFLIIITLLLVYGYQKSGGKMDELGI